MSTPSEQTVEARQRLLIAAGAALLGAGIILVAFVLPAEYAVDPLGTGARTGLLDLGLLGQQGEALSSSGATGGAAATIGEARERGLGEGGGGRSACHRIGPSSRRRWNARSARTKGWNTSPASTRVKRFSTRGKQ